MKSISITNQTVKNIGGSHLVNYWYVLTDDLDRKTAGNGSFATVSLDTVDTAIKNHLSQKLGTGFQFTPHAVPQSLAKRPTLSTART